MKKRIERPVNLFELKDVRDYNAHTTINAIRNNCVRAKELDDRQGTKQKGTYFLAMLMLADAIRKELGAKESATVSKEESATVVIEESEEYKKLETLLTDTQERSVEQEGELEELDKEIESLNTDCTDMAVKIKALEDSVTAQIEENKKLIAENKKLSTANKKLTKGAK
tara:strand:+ start:4464 stop:4970 length:507 start_codon:yes stop_codon:yes gene_type:complete